SSPGKKWWVDATGFSSSLASAFRHCNAPGRRASHRAAGFGFAEGGAGFGEAAQQRRRRPARAVALVPGGDLAGDLGRPADPIGRVHQPAAVAWEVEAAEPHHIDVGGAVGLALLKDLAGLVDRGEEEPVQDLLIRKAALLDPQFGRFLLDDARDL